MKDEYNPFPTTSLETGPFFLLMDCTALEDYDPFLCVHGVGEREGGRVLGCGGGGEHENANNFPVNSRVKAPGQRAAGEGRAVWTPCSFCGRATLQCPASPFQGGEPCGMISSN